MPRLGYLKALGDGLKVATLTTSLKVFCPQAQGQLSQGCVRSVQVVILHRLTSSAVLQNGTLAVTKFSTLDSRNYTFLGTTQSLCPECLSVVPAKIIARGKRVYFRKRCPTHGLREDFICSDRRWYDRYDYALPPKLPKKTFVEASRGCPLDCGLCTEHEQHTCVAVLEITDNCNLSCPLCYADSRPGLKHKSVQQAFAAMKASG